MSEQADKWEAKLQARGIPALTLTYGAMQKAALTVHVVECYRPVPGELLDELRDDPAIVCFALYDTASVALQEWCIMQPYLLEQAITKAQEDRVVIVPPAPPATYLLQSSPVPLLSIFDDRWIVRAVGPEGTGILIYEPGRKICFLTAEEAMVASSVLQAEGQHLHRYRNRTRSPQDVEIAPEEEGEADDD
jgi:hypothetical protein